MVNKRAQGALEFLTTYGWAFLIIIIMIGALAYFGVLDPSKLTPQRCDFFGHQFDCTGYEIQYGDLATGTSGLVKFQLVNRVGSDVELDSFNVYTETAMSYDCTYPALNTDIWRDGTTRGFTSVNDCNSADVQFSKGKKGKVIANISYHKVGSPNFVHGVEGEIYTTVR